MRTYSAVGALTIGTLALGINEFITPALLPDIADTFNISIRKAAWLKTSFMLSASLSSPVFAMLTVKLPKKTVLVGLMMMLSGSGVMCALAPNFLTILGGQILSGLVHSTYISVGSTVAPVLFKAGKQGSAVALFFSGLAVANVLGVPLSTLLAQKESWRMSFWPIVGLSGLSAAGIQFLLPNKVNVPKSNIMNECAIFKNPKVWFSFAVSSFGYAGMLASHTYFAPMMTKRAGYHASDIWWLTVLYGIGATAGNFFGGWMADKLPRGSIVILLSSLAAILAAFTFASDYKIPSAIMLFANGFFGFSLIAPLMGYTLTQADEHKTLAAASNITSFGVGISLGIYLSGLAIKSGYGYASPNVVGASLTLIGLLLFVMGESCCMKSRYSTEIKEADEYTFLKGNNSSFFSNVQKNSLAIKVVDDELDAPKQEKINENMLQY